MILRASLIGFLTILGAEVAIADPEQQQAPLHEPTLVDLSSRERASLVNDEASGHVLSNPWWENFDIHGFGAAGYYHTGSAGTREYGGFAIKEATLFIEAAVWENTTFFIELQTNRLGKDDQLFTRTGEVYVHFRDLPAGDASWGAKFGRIDIPFGEEYLWQDAIDNPLITNSAAYPYGWDEGALLYGDVKGIGWIASITDGTDDRSAEENSDKAFNLKVSGRPWDPLYLSLSAMSTGAVTKSAFEFGGSHLQPVGASHPSALGSSPSMRVEGDLVQADGKLDFRTFGQREAYLALSAGSGKQNDGDSSFDRTLRWWSIEPFLQINPEWYAVLRYSGIETDDDVEGYHFDGKIFAGGNSALGYDATSFRRLGIGAGWTPNPHVTAKLEIGKDSFDLIEASPLEADNENREFLGFEIAVRF